MYYNRTSFSPEVLGRLHCDDNVVLALVVPHLRQPVQRNLQNVICGKIMKDVFLSTILCKYIDIFYHLPCNTHNNSDKKKRDYRLLGVIVNFSHSLFFPEDVSLKPMQVFMISKNNIITVHAKVILLFTNPSRRRRLHTKVKMANCIFGDQV